MTGKICGKGIVHGVNAGAVRSCDTIFFLTDGWLTDLFIIDTQEILKTAPAGSREITLPKEVIGHSNLRMYRRMDLAAIHVSPDNPVYTSFDGALCRKDSGALVCVPGGKNTLHLSAHTQSIGHGALDGVILETITVDPDNPVFESYDGALYRKDNGRLLAAPKGKNELHLSPRIQSIDPRAFEGCCPQKIITAPENSLFQVVDGVLYDAKLENLYSISAPVSRLLIPKTVRAIHDTLWNGLYGEVAVEAGNPFFFMEQGALYTREGELLYADFLEKAFVVPAFCRTPLEEIFKRLQLLEHLTVSFSPALSTADFAGAQKNCRITLRITDTCACTVPAASPALTACLNYLKGKVPEVKAGTERMYLDLFLAGQMESAEARRVMKVSSWQVIRNLIEENDLARLEALLADGRLATRKNLPKAIRYARERERHELARRMQAHLETLS